MNKIDIITGKNLSNDLDQAFVIYNDSGLKVGMTNVFDGLPEACYSETGKFVFGRSVDDLVNLGFVESKKDGVFYETKDLMSQYSNQRFWQPYMGKPFITPEIDAKEMLKFGSKTLSYLLTGGKKYSFGVEIETYSGYVPNYIIYNSNMKVVRDGSINRDGANGGEYVTGILHGDSGMKHLQNICYEISKRCRVNQQCGLHVHIGGANFNKEFNVYAYYLGLKMQNEMFSIVPASRLNNHYCSELPMINFNELKAANNLNSKENYHDIIEVYYSNIFHYLSGGRDLCSNLNKKMKHPDGKWCKPRYHWLNLIPCNFSKDGIVDGTIEFRHHSGTTNFKKIKNFILLCMAFVSYVENNKRDIISKNSITIKDILKASYPNNYEKINNYFEERKVLFIKKPHALNSEILKIENDEYAHDSDNNSLEPIKKLIYDSRRVV